MILGCNVYILHIISIKERKTELVVGQHQERLVGERIVRRGSARSS